MVRLAKLLFVGLLAITLLLLGCVGAQLLGYATHHRYYRPNSGYYSASVHAVFNGIGDETYSFYFGGKTEPRWQWTYSSNFTYRHLSFQWDRFDDQAEWIKGRGSLSLPSLVYQSSTGTGVLTRAVLSEWLIGASDDGTSVPGSIETIFRFIEAAGRGELPATGHHGHYFEKPVSGRIQHFGSGYGVAGLVYVWIGLWLLLVLSYLQRIQRRSQDFHDDAVAVVAKQNGLR